MTKEENSIRSTESGNAEILERPDGVTLRLTLPGGIKPGATRIVDTALLGKAKVSGLGYENPDGSPLAIDTDYLGRKRDREHPSPGPLEGPWKASTSVKIW